MVVVVWDRTIGIMAFGAMEILWKSYGNIFESSRIDRSLFQQWVSWRNNPR